MTILIAPDSFKDALSAPDVCRAIERGVQQAAANLKTQTFPLADGGEGSAAILTLHNGGTTIYRAAKDPLFRQVQASYGLSGDGTTAFIDMAEASGLQLLQGRERNPLQTSTYGTGELILDAVRRGARRILLGIGGSATNDCGMGMAAAMGYRFLDAQGRELKPIGKHLGKVKKSDAEKLKFTLTDLQVTVLCDVDNPLYGPKGAAHVYGPQKGADESTVKILDEGLRDFADILQQHFGRDFAAVPGAGAAGGMGAGAMAFLNAELRPGLETVVQNTGFQQALEGADLLITGEGRIDGQTLHGKLIHGLCRLARERNVPVIALCGTLDASPADLKKIGLTAAFSILNRPTSLVEALKNTANLLEQSAFNVLRTFLAGEPFH